jgi:hypothetical protein
MPNVPPYHARVFVLYAGDTPMYRTLSAHDAVQALARMQQAYPDTIYSLRHEPR